MPLIDPFEKATGAMSDEPCHVGRVDGFTDHVLHGWIDSQNGPVVVEIYCRGGSLTSARADRLHDRNHDGGSDARWGFSIRLEPWMQRVIRMLGGVVWLYKQGTPPRMFYAFDIVAQAPALGAEPPELDGGFAQGLFAAAAELDDLVASEYADPTVARPRLSPHKVLFERPHGPDDAITMPEPISSYGAYCSAKTSLQDHIDLENDPEAAAKFFRWYLPSRAGSRLPLRVPLSREEIAYLNATVRVRSGFSISRATQLFEDAMPPALRTAIETGKEGWPLALASWWCFDGAWRLSVEDCLLPDHYVALLARIPENLGGITFAPSAFMAVMRSRFPMLAQIDLRSTEGRSRLVMALMVMAVQRPHILWFIPTSHVEAMLKPGTNGETPFSRFWHDLFPVGAQPTELITWVDYARALAQKGFDLGKMRFLSMMSDGHRLEAAMMPTPASDRSVDLQVIGPFRKASGLGQATRLSRDILDRIDNPPMTRNYVNYDMRNPQPNLSEVADQLQSYSRAKINLLHLNADTIPFVLAHQPDVFSGAYNIGYVYWELNRPAFCHYLALNILDEIWVSSDYGVSIFQPETSIPVINVGMSFEDVPTIDRATARAGVQTRFGIDPGDFTFLVEFDSYSFVDRKNPLGAVRAFRMAFGAAERVRLVIKTHNRRAVRDAAQLLIWAEIDAAIAADPRIVLLDETLDRRSALSIKAGCDAYISLHRSEGWGFGMIEAMSLGVPVICTAYSGNMEFCRPNMAWLVDYHEVPLKPSDYVYVRNGNVWAEPHIDHAAQQLRAVYRDDAMRLAKVEAARAFVGTEFSSSAISKRYAARLRAILDSLPQSPVTGG